MGLKRSVRIGRSCYMHVGTVDDVDNFDPEDYVRRPLFVDFTVGSNGDDDAVFKWDWDSSEVVGYDISDGSSVIEGNFDGEIDFIVIGTN